ncbi:uncharacterized protein LOC110813894 isoform X2 [Carica papaya]|uniref:uncharacterized protein LOC110813894 isoform X2 n=1 Tax=Carica papaya TaxID=3649 RepID=UPI000B8C7FBB|nr:uncharacterized protein LOC110813894 isoform X2 [Carica papaya]
MAISAANAAICVASRFPKLANIGHANRFQPINITPSTFISFRRYPILRVTCAAISDTDQLSHGTITTANNCWSEFCKNVSGEWDGYGAEFSKEGKPIELPESVVPEAYREWEVKVFDWQTQCPTLANPLDSTMVYKSIKLLPTVGCEADAATRYSIDEKNIGGVDNMVSAFAYKSNGSYVAIWPVGKNDKNRILELEHCLINPQDRESRLRVIQVVLIDGSKMLLQSIRVFSEQWYGPYGNGDQLGGCAIRDSTFASTAAIKASEVVGLWQGPKAVAKFDASQSNFFKEVIDGGVLRSVRDDSNLILLPKQLWCSLKRSKEAETCCEVGWGFDPGCAVTSKCIFSNDLKLKEISIGQETAGSEDV